MRSLRRPELWLPLVLAACKAGDDTVDDTDDTDTTPAPTLPGVWQAGDGGAFDGLGLGDVAFLTIEASGDHAAGFVTFHARDDATHALNCPREVWGLGPGGVLVMSGSGGEGGGGTEVFLVDQPDADTLVVTDVGGVAQTFTRVDAVAPASACGSVQVAQDVTFDLVVDSWGNLLWDGTDLRVPVDTGGVVTLDTTNGTYGGSVDYGTSYEHLQVLQGTDGWGHCACGGSEEIARTSVGGAQVDMVRTTDLGTAISVRVAALDGTELLVGGFSYDDRRSHLLRVNADAEPDSLVSDLVVAELGDAITVLDGDVYTIHGQRILRLGDDGFVDATWQLPPMYRELWWRMLTTDGTSLYVGGSGDDGAFHVLRLTLD